MANVRILASVATPAGILTALDQRAASLGRSHAQLLTRAGLLQADWDALNVALGGANAANLRRLFNGANAQLFVVESAFPVPEDANGVVGSGSSNSQVVSQYGDL